MLRIRLRRMGKRGQAYYRVVVADQRAPRDGAFIETLGAYNPHENPPLVTLDEDRAREWLSKGAQPSEAAAKILQRIGVMEGGAATAVASAPAEEAPAEASPEAAPEAATAEVAAEPSEEPPAETKTSPEAEA